MKCMDNLSEETLTEAQESNIAQVELPPREPKNRTFPAATDLLAEVKPLELREKRRGHVLSHDRTNGRRGHPVLSQIDIKHGDGNSQHSQCAILPENVYQFPTESGQDMIAKPDLDEAGDSVRPCAAVTNCKDQPDATLMYRSERNDRTNPVDPCIRLKAYMAWTSWFLTCGTANKSSGSPLA